MELERLQLLVPMVGVDFIAYASNTTPDSVNSMLAGSSLSPQVTLVINELKALIDTQFPTGDTETDGVYNVNEHLRMLNLSSLLGSQYQGNSIGNTLRVMAGGTLPLYGGSTTLEKEMGKLARDIYPILLLPRDDGGHFPDFMSISSMITPSVMRNSYEPFFDAIEADVVLNGLYVAQGENRHFKNFNYWLNTGSATGQQLISLPSELIIPAYYKVQIEGKLTPEDFISQVIENLQLFRRMANNETVEVPAYVAINGISLPENNELQLPWGTLRNPTPTELNLLSQRSQMINSVLVVPFKLKIKKSRDNSMSSPYPFLQDRARENVDEAAILTFAAIMLSLGKKIRTDNVGTIILPTFGHNPSTSWTFEKPGAANHTLNSTERAKIKRISVKLETYKKRLNVALRRNLMAINRLDTLDGFIDSIIAMESLFGSERETTFTVSSAMAKFLKSDAGQRLALKKEIAKLYNERSEIIHGASFPTPQIIEVKRQRVIDLNIEVLQKLLYRRNDLIDCASSERSTKILLT